MTIEGVAFRKKETVFSVPTKLLWTSSTDLPKNNIDIYRKMDLDLHLHLGSVNEHFTVHYARWQCYYMFFS